MDIAGAVTASVLSVIRRQLVAAGYDPDHIMLGTDYFFHYFEV